MPAIFEHEIVVLDDVIDELNHANNAAYVGWMQEAAMAHSTANGWPAERYHQENAVTVVVNTLLRLSVSHYY